MDHYEVHGQRRDMKHKGRNVVWSIAMDKCLIEALAIQTRNGNKIDKCFNENAYSVACIAVNSHFNLNLNNQKVVNRHKTIKKRYKIMKDMLSQHGFEQLYDKLKIVCGNYQASSHWAKLKDGSFQTEMKNCEDDFASFVSPSLEDVSETDGTESYTQMNRLPKRPRCLEALQDAMLAMASSIRRLADAMEQSKCSIDASKLLQAVMDIDGLEEAKQMYVVEYLNVDHVKARAFLTYNPQMRNIYLFR
ncbi:hypothetical protein UlMin_024085 [Ulmus minor]